MTTLNYVGEPALLTEPYAFPTYARQEGLPPTLIINSDHDGLRSSGEAYGAQLVAAGVDIVVIREVGVYHGHLNAPETTGAQKTVARMAHAQRTSRRTAREVGERCPVLQKRASVDVNSNFSTVSSDHEGQDGSLASASVDVPDIGTQNKTFEIGLHGPATGNPFLDVELELTCETPDGSTITVGGFYDGDGRYLARILPTVAGGWSFRTRSNARSLHGVTGSFHVESSQEPGVVHVADTHHFRYADGRRYVPVGTTVYAWIHQSDELQDETLESLRQSPFNKLRLCVFPKSYLYNSNEPDRYPFPRTEDGHWDTTRFDIEFFRRLDARIQDLAVAGIEADVILFHPYDRWGFSDLGAHADDRYVRYLVRRLAGYPNVWWSMANEYDFIRSKSRDDWERLAAIATANDHAHHLISIHNGTRIYDQDASWITHASVQRVDIYRTAENIDQWRNEWGKPVVLDECGYEGDLDQGWGNLTGKELVRRCWEGAVRGGYVQHGETFYSTDDVIWWSKGGLLKGASPERMAFLARIIAEAPDGVLDPLPSDWDVPWGGVAERYIVIYLGAGQSRFRTISMPPGTRYEVDIIDTWNMTVDRLDGVYEEVFEIPLPGREFMAIRLVALG